MTNKEAIELIPFVRASYNTKRFTKDSYMADKWFSAVEEALSDKGRRGTWEDIEHAPDGLLYVTCSVCGKRQTVEFTSYCGNCGADMRGETE